VRDSITMTGTRGPKLGPAIFRSLDGVSDVAAIITSVDGNTCSLTVFWPGAGPTFLTQIKFDPHARPSTAKGGTVYEL
jgi:hypothetical protein